MAQHSKYPPSSAYRWLNCPASVLLAPDEVEHDTTAADEGTLAHKIAELKLTADFWNDNEEELAECRNESLYKQEMEDYTDSYCDYVVSNTREATSVFVETELSMDQFMPDLFGTCDCITYDPLFYELNVIDFKYGFGRVECKDNPQLMLYALGAVEFIKDKYPDLNLDDLTIKMHIYQPRIDNITSVSTTYKKLLNWIKSQRQAIEKIKNGVTERNTGSWCKWCDRQIHCRNYQQELMDCYVDDFFSLSDLEISLNLDRLVEIEKLLKKLKAYATKQAEEGRTFPGYKLYEVNKRSWKNEEAVKKIAKENELLTAPSPNQALKKLGKKKFDELLGDYLKIIPTKQLKKDKQ